MARNIEIKAQIESVEALAPRAAALADQGPYEIIQDDTFFACAAGRLKLRAFSDEDGQLIFYQRPDDSGPKESFYILSPTTSPDTLREALTLAYGQTGRVRKHRTLFLVGRTRIHLDQVENLGHFLELEVVMSEGESPESGIAVTNDLLVKLGISPARLLRGAYVDLLNARNAGAIADAAETSSALQELSGLRERIDALDAQFVDLLAARFELTGRVGRLKKRSGLPASDADREAAQMRRIRELAADKGAKPELAQRLLRLVIDQVVENHETI